MYKKIFELQTFDFSSDFNMTYSQKVTQTDYFSSNYKATIVGVADIGQLNYPKASTAIEIFSEKASLGKIETMAFGNTFYIKIHDSLASQILGFEKFSEHWIKVEANTFDAYYGGFLFENMSITNEEKAQIYEIVKKNPPITVLQKLPDDNMEGKKVYHFKVKLSKENLINILAGFVDSAQDGKSKSDTKEKLKKIISHVELDEADLWIGKKDLYPYKFKFRFLLLNNQSPDLHVTSDATITLNKFNEYKNITAPGVSLPPQEVIDWINSHFEFPEKPL
jgi:hypothetical protein